MILIFLLGFKKALGTCPKLICGDYSSHMCSIFSEDSIQISPCLGSDICDLSHLYTNWEQGSTGHSCTAPQTSPTSDSLYELMELVCASVPDSGKKIKGSHPQICTSDNDCELIDGSFAQCLCGLSQQGFSYCEVSEGDEESISMQKAACVKDIDNFVWHLLRKEFYVYLHDRPICAGFVFEDLAAIDYLFAGGSLVEIVYEFSGAGFVLLIGSLFVI